MNWERIDDLDLDGNCRVTYSLIGYNFSIIATKLGVQITGTTPFYTDFVPVQEKLSWAQYQHQRLKETGRPISQHRLDEGTV